MDADRHPPSRGTDLDDLDDFRAEVESAERKLAREFEVSPRIVVAAVAVLALLGSLVLPHTGSLTGLEILTNDAKAQNTSLVIVSRVFVWLVLIFGIFASGAALVTRRWVLSVLAGAGTGVGVIYGLLSVWSRQTPGLHGEPPTGVGIGLVLGCVAMIVLAVVWIKTIWARTAYQFDAEQQRREAAQEWESFARTNRLGPQRPDPTGSSTSSTEN